MTNKLNIKKMVTVAVILMVSLTLIKSVGLLVSFASLNRDLNEKTEQLEELNEETKCFEKLLLPENESTLMEEYAHRMGYAYPDERLYIFK